MPHSARTTLLASAAFLTVGAPIAAQEYGGYADETLRTLVTQYPGRYAGTEAFEGAADYMAQRLSGIGSGPVRQTFVAPNVDLPSQNVIATLPGAGEELIVVGAHFDSFFGRPTLEGVDDNASGAAVLTEVANHLSGLDLGRGLVFNAFGAEETGLEGSQFYAESLSENELGRLAGMINIDSLVTGDFKYANSGTNSVETPALDAYRMRVIRIAEELGIDLRSNPGLNPDYPENTGCCSDGDVFNVFDIPVVYFEATNWSIGDLDGYTQTTDPDFPDGRTWHDPETDNLAFLTENLPEGRIEERLSLYSRLITRLLVELTDADVIASAQSAAEAGFATADLLARQEEAGLRSVQRARIHGLPASGGAGPISGGFTLGAAAALGGSGDDTGVDDLTGADIGIWGEWLPRSDLRLGADLRYTTDQADLPGGGEVDADRIAARLDAFYQGASPVWLAGSVGAARTDLSGRRDFRLESGLGATILSESFDFDTDATTFGAEIEGGYDLRYGSVVTGPLAGLDYRKIDMDGYREASDARTALAVDDLSFESLEARIGWQARTDLTVGANAVLSPYARISLVRELSEGRPDTITGSAPAAGLSGSVSTGGYDETFGTARIGASYAASDRLSTFAEVDTRFGHDDGDWATLSVGLSVRF